MGGDMTDAPKMIWATGDDRNGSWTHVSPRREWDTGAITYIRLDAPELVALRDGLVRLCDWIEDECGADLPNDARTALAAFNALIARAGETE